MGTCIGSTSIARDFCFGIHRKRWWSLAREQAPTSDICRREPALSRWNQIPTCTKRSFAAHANSEYVSTFIRRRPRRSTSRMSPQISPFAAWSFAQWTILTPYSRRSYVFCVRVAFSSASNTCERLPDQHVIVRNEFWSARGIGYSKAAIYAGTLARRYAAPVSPTLTWSLSSYRP